jgi:hypothetical protein
MYVTEIVRLDSNRTVGPTFFSGARQSQFETLKEARTAARKWCDDHDLIESEYKIISSIVGCL